jgi:hypothetical protein
MCRDGLKYYARIPGKNIRAALEEVERQRTALHQARPRTRAGAILAVELELAARMAVESGRIMLWQQAVVDGRDAPARRMAAAGIRALRELDHDFRGYWPLRNKGTTAKCSPFLQWRALDYSRGIVHYPPEVARMPEPGVNSPPGLS